jgi:hypothetical protein
MRKFANKVQKKCEPLLPPKWRTQGVDDHHAKYHAARSKAMLR